MIKHPQFSILLKILLLLAGFICLIPAYVQAQEPTPNSSTIQLNNGWEYRWETKTVNENGPHPELFDNANWQTLGNVNQLNQKDSNILWMRLTLPQGEWRDPSLFFDSVDQGLEVYLEQDLIYKAGKIARTGNEPALGTIHHIVLLPPDYGGKTLSIRFFSLYNTIGPRGGVFIGSQSDHILTIIKADIDRFTLAIILLVIGLAALAFYLTFLSEISFLGLAILSVSAGSFILWRTQLVELFTANIFLQDYSKIGGIFFFPVGLGLFFEHTIGPGPKKLVRRLWQISLFYAITAISLSLLGVVQLLNTVLPFEILAAVILIILLVISIKEALRGNTNARLFTLGYGLVFIFAFIEIFDELGFYTLPRRALHWGILGFILVLVIIMLRRYRQAVVAQTKLGDIEEELKTAHQIQQNLLLPAHPPWTTPQMVCYTAPAREMGGDLYAYYPFSDNHLAVVVGDVSGKGMPAALLMGVSLSSLNSSINQRLSPSQLLLQLDGILAPYTRATKQNCALCYIDMALNGQSASLKAANAGCITPIIKRNDGKLEWINIGGIPLGLGLGQQSGYKEESFTLQTGDALVLVSDGVIEARNSNLELFGFHRFEQAISQAPANNAQAILDYLKTTVTSFVGEATPHDDMTIVVLQM